jgi:Xaa-Pro aminopeptidase
MIPAETGQETHFKERVMDQTVGKHRPEPDDLDPQYRWDRHLPAWGIMGVDFESRIEFDRLRRYRIARAKQALERSECGALLLFDVNNIRYTTATKIGEWERDKLARFALLAKGKEPILWDFGSAAVHHKLYSPWLEPENCKAGLIGLRGTVPPAFGLMKRHAEEIASLLKEAGVDKLPVGVDIVEPPMMFELQKAGLKIVDGQQIMLEAREIKNIDEIALLTRAATMVDGVYHQIYEELRPGIRESQIVANANRFRHTRERHRRSRQQDALRDGQRRRRGDQRHFRRALQPASAQFH